MVMNILTGMRMSTLMEIKSTLTNILTRTPMSISTNTFMITAIPLILTRMTTNTAASTARTIMTIPVMKGKCINTSTEGRPGMVGGLRAEGRDLLPVEI